VLKLRTSQGWGSGFLITESGTAVTNAHVVGNEHELVADTVAGQSFQAKLLYVDPKLDVALVQLQGNGFPHLRIDDSSGMHPGSSVIAIGSPSKGFPNSVTKGVVSAMGVMPNEPGTWIQTDASINPGNSGGPLLNGAGAVVGITTQKEFASGDGRPLQGIGFALSSDDILGILRQLSPEVASQIQPSTSSENRATGSGVVRVSADVEDADIFLDGKFVGNAPSSLHISSGKHRIEIKNTDGQAWSRTMDVTDGSDTSRNTEIQSP